MDAVRPYEMLYILDPRLSEEALAQVMQQIEGIVVDLGGEVQETVTRHPWGKRRLAYPIRRVQEGFYVLLRLTLPPQATGELDRRLRLIEPLMRYILTHPVKVREEVPTETEEAQEVEAVEGEGTEA